MQSWPPSKVSLSPNKRVLFLTKDLDLIRTQLYEGLDLRMEDLSIDDLLDDINTDVMTPAWVCFDHDPAILAEKRPLNVRDGQELELSSPHPLLLFTRGIISISDS